MGAAALSEKEGTASDVWNLRLCDLLMIVESMSERASGCELQFQITVA